MVDPMNQKLKDGGAKQWELNDVLPIHMQLLFAHCSQDVGMIAEELFVHDLGDFVCAYYNGESDALVQAVYKALTWLYVDYVVFLIPNRRAIVETFVPVAAHIL